jgi:demethylmenaquinone methyltransferase / 2-methoxy-6-polyprenyl-1,4-benzoquinol methylase
VLELGDETEIAAPPEQVWDALTDFAAYAEWNPFVTCLSGPVRVGAALVARLEAPGARGMTVRLRLTKLDRPRELRWEGRFPRARLPGLVHAERVMAIEPLSPGRARLTQRTVFRGALVPLLRGLRRYGPGFAAMNAALKARIEGGSRAPGAAPSPRKAHALGLFSGLGSDYDRMGALLSFGQDPRWRRALVGTVGASPGDRVLDVATGTGLVAAQLARRYGCRVVALDQSQEMLDAARARLARDPNLAARVELVRGEAERLPFAPGEFDALTFTYLLRYVDDPGPTMRELARVVAPGGRIAMLEFGIPQHPVLRAPWWLYTRAGLPVAGRLASREWYEVGRFLGPSISDFGLRHPPERLRELWRAAGIGGVEIRRMSFGAGVVMWGTRDGG